MILESNELMGDDSEMHSTQRSKLKFKNMRTSMKQNRFNSGKDFDMFEDIISNRRGEIDFSHKQSYTNPEDKMFKELEYLVVCKLILVDEIYALMKLICRNQERH